MSRRNKIADLLRRGLSWEEIREQLGCSEAAIRVAEASIKRGKSWEPDGDREK